jgi:hypothetical protein
MLFGSPLPLKLWPQAITTALYIKNRLPHTSIPQHTTPFELWHNRKPDLSHLRVFGCSAHVHVLEETCKKLNERSSNWKSFAGCDSRIDHIFTIWDPSNDSFIRERSIIFDETRLICATIMTNNGELHKMVKYEFVDLH